MPIGLSSIAKDKARLIAQMPRELDDPYISPGAPRLFLNLSIPSGLWRRSRWITSSFYSYELTEEPTAPTLCTVLQHSRLRQSATGAAIEALSSPKLILRYLDDMDSSSLVFILEFSW